MLNHFKRLTVTLHHNFIRIYNLFKLTPRDYFIDEKTYWVIKNNPDIVEELYKK